MAELVEMVVGTKLDISLKTRTVCQNISTQSSQPYFFAFE